MAADKVREEAAGWVRYIKGGGGALREGRRVGRGVMPRPDSGGGGGSVSPRGRKAALEWAGLLGWAYGPLRREVFC